ncbi:MAG: alpha/beta hydrolase [Methylococcaceae bacterium]|nr:alpha/beta hydrolase [Methylococcaceae bacterium]
MWIFDFNKLQFLLRPSAHGKHFGHPSRYAWILLLILILAVFTGKGLLKSPILSSSRQPRLEDHYFMTTDNAKLAVRRWFPDKQPIKAVIIALHGFNDYSNFFNGPGNYLKEFGIASYAYDQSGFGSSPGRGYWTEIDVSTRDLTEISQLIRKRHPCIPLYLLGESMGAAEIIVTLADDQPPPVDGVILSSPAVWAWEYIPWYQRIGLWLAAHTVPWLELTGTGLHLIPSDNIKMLRELSHDPLVLKKSRISTIYGLADLMNQAFKKAKHLEKPALVLYGDRDQIVPKKSVFRMLKEVPAEREWHIALYENGYHLLLRDMEASTYWRDIAAWIDNPGSPLPSGADQRAAVFFNRSH